MTPLIVGIVGAAIALAFFWGDARGYARGVSKTAKCFRSYGEAPGSVVELDRTWGTR